MADRYIPEHRRTNYKAKGAFATDVVRRRREEQQVEIRKAKREENLAKRRGIGTGENRPGASLGAAPDSDDDTAPTESQVRFAFPSILRALRFCNRPHSFLHIDRAGAGMMELVLVARDSPRCFETSGPCDNRHRHNRPSSPACPPP